MIHQSYEMHTIFYTIMFRLYVIRGTPKNELPKIFNEWNVTLITIESEIEPFNVRRDALVKIHADQLNVKLDEFQSHTIYNPHLVLQSNNNEIPMRYQSFLALVEKMKVAPVVSITAKHKLNQQHQPPKDSKEVANGLCYDLPDLSELPLNTAELGPNEYHGGEQEALERLDKVLARKQWVTTFEKPKTAPNSIEPSTTVLR